MASESQPPHANSTETLSDAVARVMSEADEWRRIVSLDADTLIRVYLDMKSPHAYIAVRPTLEIARDYRVKIDFCPYTLSYTGMGISTSVDNNERRPPSQEAERRARMFYAVARQYTALQLFNSCISIKLRRCLSWVLLKLSIGHSSVITVAS